MGILHKPALSAYRTPLQVSPYRPAAGGGRSLTTLCSCLRVLTMYRNNAIIENE